MYQIKLFNQKRDDHFTLNMDAVQLAPTTNLSNLFSWALRLQAMECSLCMFFFFCNYRKKVLLGRMFFSYQQVFMNGIQFKHRMKNMVEPEANPSRPDIVDPPAQIISSMIVSYHLHVILNPGIICSRSDIMFLFYIQTSSHSALSQHVKHHYQSVTLTIEVL